MYRRPMTEVAAYDLRLRASSPLQFADDLTRRFRAQHFNLMPRAGLEPARPFGPEDFKSSVSAIPPPRPNDSEFMYSTINLQGQRSQFCDNPLARMSVAVRIDRAGHPFILRLVI